MCIHILNFHLIIKVRVAYITISLEFFTQRARHERCKKNSYFFTVFPFVCHVCCVKSYSE